MQSPPSATNPSQPGNTAPTGQEPSFFDSSIEEFASSDNATAAAEEVIANREKFADIAYSEKLDVATLKAMFEDPKTLQRLKLARFGEKPWGGGGNIDFARAWFEALDKPSEAYLKFLTPDSRWYWPKEFDEKIRDYDYYTGLYNWPGADDRDKWAGQAWKAREEMDRLIEGLFERLRLQADLVEVEEVVQA